MLLFMMTSTNCLAMHVKYIITVSTIKILSFRADSIHRKPKSNCSLVTILPVIRICKDAIPSAHLCGHYHGRTGVTEGINSRAKAGCACSTWGMGIVWVFWVFLVSCIFYLSIPFLFFSCFLSSSFWGTV